MKKITVIISLILALLIVGYVYKMASAPTVPVLSFEDCEKAGYPVMESNPRQCKTPDGRTYAEELPGKVTYVNATEDKIVIKNPYPNAVTGKEFTVTGKARGTWYFEASFPIQVLDKDGKVMTTVVAQAQSDWMTTEFVPFKAEVKVPESYIGKATLLLKNDNPSGLPERDSSASIDITIEY